MGFRLSGVVDADALSAPLSSRSQSSERTILHFIEPNWPDIGVADILPPLLSYQAEVWVERVAQAVGRCTSWLSRSGRSKAE